MNTDNLPSSTPEPMVPTQPTLTFGQQAVGLDFNPSGSRPVIHIKHTSAELIDILNYYRNESTSSEVKAQLTLAIRKVQEAQMWAVKGVTWKY